MCTIPVYDYGELNLLIFGLVEDGRLQVKVNGWIICSTCTNFQCLRVGPYNLHLVEIASWNT